MILHGFSFDWDSVIKVEERHHDLHNDYLLAGLDYDALTRGLKIHWTRSTGDWVSGSLPRGLTLEFENVFVFRVREPAEGEAIVEDLTLNQMGFMWNSMREDMDGVAAAAPGEACTDLVFCFMSGLSIKVGASSARIVLDDQPL